MKTPTRRKIFNVVGESRTNPDGRSRQDILCDVEPGEGVSLIRERENNYDPNAIQVVIGGDVVGYLGHDDAAEIAPALDFGRAHSAIVHCIRGGVPGYPSYGCQVSIAWDDRPPHPHIDLDDQQLRSRRSKKGARTRRLGNQSRTTSPLDQKPGCLGLFALLAVPGLAVALGIFIGFH